MTARTADVRPVYEARMASAPIIAALVVGLTVKAPRLRAKIVQRSVASYYRSGNASKRIALTSMEVAALRLAARTVGLI